MRTTAMPPGPPLPMPVQTAIWSRQARRFLYACQDRYGDVFTLKVLRETWVVLADPDAVKQDSEIMGEIAAREIEGWPTGVPYKLRPRMQALTPLRRRRPPLPRRLLRPVRDGGRPARVGETS